MSDALHIARYLYSHHPRELFPQFVDRILDGASAEAILRATCGDDFRDMTGFEKRFRRFTR